MKSKTINGVRVIFDSREQATADLIADSAAQALHLIQESWGLRSPEDCRIYVMTSWWGFFFQSAPWLWKIMLSLTFPFWYSRARRTWPYSAAWTQRYGRRVAIGIKPPSLLEISDKSIGLLMFEEEKDPREKIRHLTCHELTHACSAHLKLPAWLNEGLAAVTVDRLFEKRTIRSDTLELLRSYTPKERPLTYRELSRQGGKAIAYQAVRGYWLVQYLEDCHPGFLKGNFSSTGEGQAIEEAVARELGIEPDRFWSEIDDRISAHFGLEQPGAGDGGG
ncbi:MAG: hypothetical protein M1281_15540 [Chloroflexi bacterium]|nr:hypothetical protein [Chloroflexota bacterium]